MTETRSPFAIATDRSVRDRLENNLVDFALGLHARHTFERQYAVERAFETVAGNLAREAHKSEYFFDYIIETCRQALGWQRMHDGASEYEDDPVVQAASQNPGEREPITQNEVEREVSEYCVRDEWEDEDRLNIARALIGAAIKITMTGFAEDMIGRAEDMKKWWRSYGDQWIRENVAN